MNHVRIADTTGARLVGDPEKTRTLEFIISTNARDSHRTVLNQNAWDLTRYARNGVVGYQHELWGGTMCSASDPDHVIGPGRAWVENPGSDAAQLIGEWRAEPREINELADKVFRKVLFGTLKATSVGFAETGIGKWGEGEEAEGQPRATYYFSGQELFEWSIVHMGSNPETVKRNLRPQVGAALNYLRTQVPELSARDVMSMTVRDVLAVVEGKPLQAALVSTTAREQRQPLTSFLEESLAVSETFRAATAKALAR